MLLALAMIAAVAIGCAETNRPEPGTTTGTGSTGKGDGTEVTDEVTTARILPNLPEMDYDGREYRILASNVFGYRIWEDLFVESEGDNPISQGVWRRNLAVEEKYKVKITMREEQYLDYEGLIQQTASTGESIADVYVSLGDNIQRLYGQNVFANLADMDYLELDKPWWNQGAVDSFNINGYMPFGICNLTINDFGTAGAIFFNKRLATDYNVGNMYEIVENKEWTMAKLLELCKPLYIDLDKDGHEGPLDQFGLTGDDGLVNHFFVSGGGRYVSKDDEGLPYDSFYTQRNVNMMQYFLEQILFDKQITFNSSQFKVEDEPYSGSYNNTIFSEGRALFKQGPLSVTEQFRESMIDDFGIIPVPMYDETQKDYCSLAQPYGGSVVSIPYYVDDADFSSIILEALAAEAHYTLVPGFYDVVLKTKNTRDDESAAMIELILNNRVYDLGMYYNFAGFAMNTVFLTGCQEWYSGVSQTSDIASYYAKYETQVAKAISKLIKAVEKWGY